MRKLLLLFIGSFFCLSVLHAQTTKSLNPIASVLFKNIKSTLTVDEKNFIANKIGFVLSGNKDQPFALDTESKDYPFGALVMPTDLNNDKKEEIFIHFGNSYTSGNTGSSITLFIKNTAGTYEMNLGFPGVIPDVLTTMSKSYPDLLVGGPGFEFPVFRWNGKVYATYKSVKNSEYEKLKKTGADQLSKEYQKTID